MTIEEEVHIISEEILKNFEKKRDVLTGALEEAELSGIPVDWEKFPEEWDNLMVSTIKSGILKYIAIKGWGSSGEPDNQVSV